MSKHRMLKVNSDTILFHGGIDIVNLEQSYKTFVYKIDENKWEEVIKDLNIKT